MRNVPGGLLRRIHLFEIHDQPWLPHSLRDAVTDILQWILNLTKVYASVEPRLRAALKRYEETFGFCVISDFGERGCAIHAGTRQMLLLFMKGASRATQTPHDGDGELHVAFAIPTNELANWELWLQTRGITVEEKRKWELGGWSLYFRDPDRHLIKLATPGFGRCIERRCPVTRRFLERSARAVVL